MKTNDKNLLKAIEAHKEYFDEKLILLTKNQEKMIESLKSSLFKKYLTINKLSYKVENLTFKLKEANNKIYNLKKFDQENEELKKIIKDLNDELDELKSIKKEYQKELDILKKEKDQAHKINDELRKKIKKLESVNSTNSNMPSSYDILTHSKKITNTRIKAGRTKGGQNGHKLHKSKLYNHPDEVIDTKVKDIPNGAIPVFNDGKLLYHKVQEVDIKVIRYIKEYHLYKDEEGVDFKRYAINPLIYSNNLKALAIYLNQRGTIPLKRLSSIIKEMVDIDIKESTLVKWNREFAYKAISYKEKILNNIKDKDVIHVDETSFKLNGTNIWMHDISNDKGTYILASLKRKSDEVKDYLYDYTGHLVHDHYKPYYDIPSKHAECNAHIDRYLKSAIDFEKSTEAKEVLDLLHKALKEKKELIDNGQHYMPKERIAYYKYHILAVLEQTVKSYYQSKPDIVKRNEPDHIKLFKRMIAYIDNHLAFITDFNVPYTNNEAERQCRAIKAKKNTSGQFVSFDSASAYTTTLSIIQTANKNNQAILPLFNDILSR